MVEKMKNNEARELVFKLVKIMEAHMEDGESFTFIYQLDNAIYGKDVKFIIRCDDPYQTLGFLGLPQSIGDEITVTMTSKTYQVSLADTVRV